MASLFVLDVDDFTPFWQNATSEHGCTVTKKGHYMQVTFDDVLTIDRRSTGLRHALWYSAVGGVNGATIVQYDKDQLKLVATGAAGG